MSVPRVILMAFVAATLLHVASAVAGQATFYTTYTPSACYGFQDQGTMIAAVNEPLWASGAACGGSYRIRCTGATNQGVPWYCRNGEITVRVVDRCPGCRANQFDLSQEAFSRIADTTAGRINIDYNRLISSPAPARAPAPAPGATAFVPNPTKHSRNWIKFFLGATATLLVLLTLVGLFWRRQRKNDCFQALSNGVQSRKLREKAKDDSLFYSFATIEIAANNFSDENILGRGGYGPVYKGKLLNGQEIAVKRLQKMSGHGIEQFKNEVTVISNLQHRNLVRLLGYCTDNDERILIYEYLPKKSLDSILFGDAETRAILGWKSRLQIIEGIAQGLLYLHKYSRLKIIHRDLKTSNILLDNDLNPKISDFGTAKIFGDSELCANTNRIVGTFGYMSPEYAMDGIFSVKSDVFSFGVMMLEIISGKKNSAFYNSDRHINLLGYVWDLWIEERVLEIIDPNLSETILIGEVVRYVQVGLLCVQENAGDRPTMSIVVCMLQNESMSLPDPKQPSFTAILHPTNSNPCENLESASVNMVTITDVGGR